MTDAARFAIPAAMVLAIAGAFFGVVIARIVWGDDLRHSLELKEYWDKSKTAMEGTIASQQRSIQAQEHTITILKSRLGEPR